MSSSAASSVLREGSMTKRAQGKKKGSPKNWKDRYFVLTPSELSYWDKVGGPHAAGAVKKGSIEVNSIRAVEEVKDSSFERLHLFQVVHSTPPLTLYIQARDSADRAAWLQLLRELAASSPFRTRNYHPAAFDGRSWTCCGAGAIEAEGCAMSTTVAPKGSDLPQAAAGKKQSGALGEENGGTVPPPLGPKPVGAVAGGIPRNDSSSSQGSSGGSASLESASSPGRLIPPLGAAADDIAGAAQLPSLANYTPMSPSIALPDILTPKPAGPAAGSSTPVATKRAPPPPPPPEPEPLPPGKQKQMRVMFSYVASQDGDLSIQKDEIITILEERPNWWRAQNRFGQKGMVPSNYLGELGMESEPWFRGKISRTEATAELLLAKQEGCFLVRESETQPGEYTLSLSHGDGVRHYRIQHVSEQYFVNENHRFDSIIKMIEYHKLNSGGIVTRLRRSIADANAPVSVGLGYGVLELERSEFTLGKELGSGQFGVVQQATFRNGRAVAIKMMKEGKMSADDFMSEAIVMRDLSHPHLVQLLGVCTRDGPLWIVVELMSKGCLLNYLREHAELKKQPAVMHMMTVHIASAMSYLESKGFIHRDLAARNCLLGDNFLVKVADFGLARFVTDDEYISSEGTQFPIKWSAPEVINYTRFSTKSDVWSFGITMWEIWSLGTIPYPTHRNHEISELLATGYRMPSPPDAPIPAYQLMRDCWHQDPECRPTFAEVFVRVRDNKEEYS